MSDIPNVQPVGSWGRKQLYPARVGTGPSNVIMVKGVRAFRVGQHIQFCTLNDAQGMCGRWAIVR